MKQKKIILKPFAKGYLRKQQAAYIEDLRKALAYILTEYEGRNHSHGKTGRDLFGKECRVIMTIIGVGDYAYIISRR